MDIKTANTETDFENINQFFGNIWKKEFDLDRFDRVYEYKSGKVYFLEENSKIISAIYLYEKNSKIHIGRFATTKEKRGTGIGSKLFKEIVKNYKNKDIFVWIACKRENFYKKLGFIKTGIKNNIGNTTALEMTYKHN